MEVTNKMTSGNDIILKSWLRTLRYSIEYYEDTFDSKNNRCRENSRSAKNMLIGGIGGDASDDSDDDSHYVNIWECSDSEKSGSNIKHSLESVVGNTSSEVSNFEGENTTSVSPYMSEEAESVERKFGEKSEITDLDDANREIKVKRATKKPVPAPRLSKNLDNNDSIYENLPLRSSISKSSSGNKNDYDLSDTTPVFTEDTIYENIPFHKHSSPIYENLSSLNKKHHTSTDSMIFEEEVFSTIQYLENVIQSVDIHSDDSESEDSMINRTDADDSNFEHENSDINDEKFTESSSSFEEYLSNAQCKYTEVKPQSLNQRFAKDNRVSLFIDEQEPSLPQEVKNIPTPGSRNTTSEIRKRLSEPLKIVEDKIHLRRPQSLEAHQDQKVVDDKQHTGDLESFDSFETSLRLKNETTSSPSQTLNVSFAKESRISSVFEEGVVEDLHISEPPLSESLVVEEEEFIESLRPDVLIWMAALMEECVGELEDIMEEKELLKSINQVSKDRPERPPENKFPLDDDVEFRRQPEIRTHRLSKTTDFDAGRRRRQTSPINPKNFEIRGIVKIEVSSKPILTKWKEEYIAYENENFYRVNEKTKSKELLASNVIIKSVRYPKSKESKEVELRDSKNIVYVLHFQELKYAKQFMENEKIHVYINDNKVNIKKTLLRFFGKRSSREFLEQKGIYRNEPIFGNTLRDIYIKSGSNALVPAFIYEVINLWEQPENIKTLGLYRTSGNLATIQKIRCEVDNGRLNILAQYAKDPDVLTGSLKLFFRELKEPLIPREVCDKLLEYAKLDPKQMSSKEHQKIRSILVKNLHEANLETFIVIMYHLLEVVKYKDHNKMDSYNLAVCWGPSIVFSVHGADLAPTIELSKDIMTQSHDATRLIDFFLVYYELYPAELGTLGKRQRPESITEKILSLKRQESRDSVGSLDSSKSQKKSASSLSLSVDEITKKLVEYIEPHIASEGLYKNAGSSDKTNKIVKKLNKKKIHEIEKYKNDVHDLTDALKKYLKEQDPLVSEDTVELVLKASPDSSHSCLEPATRRKVISLIEDTPKKDTLIFLLRHLAKVLEYQEQTHNVPKYELINVWSSVLNNQKKSKLSNEDFAKFLAIAVKVFNDNLPDVVRSSFGNSRSSPMRNESMDELMKEMKHQHAERDRNSRYDNVDSDVGEASILDDKTEQTKL